MLELSFAFLKETQNILFGFDFSALWEVCLLLTNISYGYWDISSMGTRKYGFIHQAHTGDLSPDPF